jgi:hypothetical protein
MKLKSNRNKFQLYIFIIFSFFVLILFINNAYSSLQKSIITRNSYKKEIVENNKKLIVLNNIEINIEENNDNISDKINKLLVSFNRKELLRYFYDYVEKAYSTENIIEIK